MTLTRRDVLKKTGVACTLALAPNLIACGDDGGGTPVGEGSGSGSGSGEGSGAGEGSGEDAFVDDLPRYEYEGELGPETIFSHGVASGDPLADAVVIWTRVTPAAEGPVTVWYEVSRTADFSERVSVGEFVADADKDYTVKLDVIDLEAGGTYYYRFFALGRESATGRTRTAGDAERLRFGVVSCSSINWGYFHSYRQLAQQADLDAVLHLGDYIYEYGTGVYGEVRPSEPEGEMITLSDYRTRYAQYRRDEDLQAVHRQHPFIVVWDDHESTDNSFALGAENHQPETEGDWEERKAIARQAYLEWLPIREFEGGRIYRAFQYGSLVDLIMLDTRIEGRDEQAAAGNLEEYADPERTILGETQEAWLRDQLTASQATWRIVGQQVIFAQWTLGGTALNADAWDGYSASRDRVLDTIQDNGLDNVVVLTGDVHSAWVFDVPRDGFADAYDEATGEGSLAVEFVCSSVTSPAVNVPASVLVDGNPHLKYGDLARRGYMVLDVTAERTHCTMWAFDDGVESPDDQAPVVGATYETLAGSNRVQEAQPVEPRSDAPPLAP